MRERKKRQGQRERRESLWGGRTEKTMLLAGNGSHTAWLLMGCSVMCRWHVTASMCKVALNLVLMKEDV